MRDTNPDDSLPAPAALAAMHATDAAPRRRRLWELDAALQAAVIGRCLQPAALRRLAADAAGAAPADDRDLHWLVLGECAARTALADALQKELDRRHQFALRRAGLATDEATLAAWWRDASVRSGLAGALWAVATHAQATTALGQRVLADLHALQQVAGSSSDGGAARIDALIRENQILSRELGAAQQRSMRMAADHAQAAQAAESTTVRLRAELLRRDLEIEQWRERVRELEAAAQDSASNERASRLQREQATRLVELQRALRQAEQQCEHQRLRNAELANELAAVRRTVTVAPAVRAGLASAALRDRSVLCVSTRTASVPVYRRFVESTGGRFVHHDDDAEAASDGRDLDARLDAADLVICQTGCLSHDAYWRVKTHCRRTGKRCVFVETASRRALERALGEVAPAASGPDEAATAPPPAAVGLA